MLMLNILKNYMNLMFYHFYQKESKFKKSKKLVANLHDKTECFIEIRNSKQALNSRSGF